MNGGYQRPAEQDDTGTVRTGAVIDDSGGVVYLGILSRSVFVEWKILNVHEGLGSYAGPIKKSARDRGHLEA